MGGGGGAFGQKPPPRCCYSPRFGSKATSGILPAKAAAGFGILPPKAGLFNPGKRARAEPGSPPPREPQPPVPLPAGAAGPRRGWGLAASFLSLGKGEGQIPQLCGGTAFPGEEKKKKSKRKREWADHPKGTGGDGSPGPRGEGGLGSLPGAWRKAPGGSVGDAAGGRMAKGEWWKRHSPRFTFF